MERSAADIPDVPFFGGGILGPPIGPQGDAAADRQRDGCPVCGGPCMDGACQWDTPKPSDAACRPDLDGLRAKLSGWHFAKESLTAGEREILAVAEAVLAELDRRDVAGYAR